MTTLKSDFSNIAEWIDSLFDKDVRKPEWIEDAAKSAALWYSFADPTSRYRVLSTWLAAWKIRGDQLSHIGQSPSFPNAQYICETDQDIINFLAKYIFDNKLDLYVPSLTFSSKAAAEPTTHRAYYENGGYDRLAFRGSDGRFDYGGFDSDGMPTGGTVAWFLWYLFHGAHFVVVCAQGDGAAIATDFHSAFMDSVSKDEVAECPADSHYGTHLSTDNYFLDVENDVPNPPAFILALLIGTTSTGDTNGFLQLEA